MEARRKVLIAFGILILFGAGLAVIQIWHFGSLTGLVMFEDIEFDRSFNFENTNYLLGFTTVLILLIAFLLFSFRKVKEERSKRDVVESSGRKFIELDFKN